MLGSKAVAVQGGQAILLRTTRKEGLACFGGHPPKKHSPKAWQTTTSTTLPQRFYHTPQAPSTTHLHAALPSTAWPPALAAPLDIAALQRGRGGVRRRAN